jgi:hypothetical protein
LLSISSCAAMAWVLFSIVLVPAFVAPPPPPPAVGPGGAVQVDPIKPTLKAHGFKRLTLVRDHPLSSFAFKFYLRRYSLVATWIGSVSPCSASVARARRLPQLPLLRRRRRHR